MVCTDCLRTALLIGLGGKKVAVGPTSLLMRRLVRTAGAEWSRSGYVIQMSVFLIRAHGLVSLCRILQAKPSSRNGRPSWNFGSKSGILTASSSMLHKLTTASRQMGLVSASLSLTRFEN